MRDDETTKEGLVFALDRLSNSGREGRESPRFGIERAVDGIWQWNIQTNEISYSRAIEHVFGYGEKETGTHHLNEWARRVHPDDQKAVMEHIARFLRGDKDARGTEHRVRCKDGTYKWVFLRGEMVSRTEDGKPLLAVGTFTDVDERKRMEEALRESESKFRGITEKSLVGMYLIQDDVFQYINAKFAGIFGYEVDEIAGKMGVENLTFPADWPMVHDNLGKRTSGKLDSLHYEFRGVTKNGAVRNIEAYSSLMTYRGRPALIGTLLDVTERRQSEEALRESESKFRDLAEKSLAGIYLIQDDIIHYANAKSAETVGYTLDEIMGKMPLESIIHPQDWPLVKENLRKRICGEVDSLNYELRILTKQGEVRNAEIYSSRTTYKGKPAVIGTLLDITERKNSQRVLLESEARLRQVIDLVPHFIFAKDSDGKFILANKAVADAYQTTVEELTGKTDADFNRNIDEVAQFLQDDIEVIRSGRPKDIPEERITTTGGNVRMLQTTKIPFTLSMTGAEAVIGVSTDITERLRTQKALHESEEKYRNIFENAIEGIFQSTPDGKLITVNRALAAMAGYETPEEMMNAIEDLGKIYVETERRRQLEKLLAVKNSVEAFQARIYRKDGGIIWASMNARAVEDEMGSIRYYEGTVEDVTKAKEAEEALLRSEEELRALVGSINDTIMVVDKHGKCIKIAAMNPDRLFKPANGVVGKTFKDFLPGETAELFLKNVRKALKTRRTVNVEHCTGTGDEEYWFSTAISPMTHELTVCVARDITELKITEKKLHAKSITLEEMNAALKILLKNMEEAKREFEENIVSNIKMLVIPYVEKLKKLRPTDIQNTYIDLIETNLRSIASPFLHGLAHFNLTPREIQIVNYIKDGKTTKDIMQLLHSSKETIDIHRYNIRKKLGINKKKINLHSYLLSIR